MVSNFPSRRRSRKSPQTPLRAPIRLPPGGGSAVRRWRSPRALHFRTTAPSAHKLHSPLGGQCTFFFAQKKKVPKKKCANLRFDRPDARATIQENSDLTSRTNFRCKWGATEGFQMPPITDFSPPSAYGQTPSLITRTAPRAPYGHRRGLCVVISVRAQSPFPHLPERSDR